MRFSVLFSFVLPLLPLALAIPSPASPVSSVAESAREFAVLTQKAIDTVLERLDAEELALRKRGQTANCTRKNISIRREFGSLSIHERKAYTDAVLCLQSKKANTPAAVAAGARSRFDDFIVAHIQQTFFVHYSGTFLSWHRFYIWVYEKALKEECGFKGSIPYWEWSKWADAPQLSPLFNGDDYSMSGNGEYIPGHAGVTLMLSFPDFGITPIYLAPGLGGGCVTTGPFKNYTVNLGPIGMQDQPVGPEGGLGYNPRCMKRDIGPAVATKYTNWTAVLETLNQKTLEDFQYQLQGRPGAYTIGPHGGGHYTIGGNPGGDVFVSPGDPAFYLHHGQIDRIWTIWQALDPKTRQYALSGTNTLLNIPPSANTTLEDTMNLSYAGGGTIKVGDALSTTKGPFCYLYM